MGPIQALISFLGRALLSGIFLMSAVANHIPKFDDVVGVIEKEGVPEPKIAHIVAIAFMLIGGVSVLMGFKARIGALLLILFLGAATYYFHDFWTIEDATKKQEEMMNFMKNATILGGLLFILANGSGAGAVDKRRVTLEV